VILYEDIHWIDPTSLDMLNRIIARIAGLPALLVVTFRPELQPTWVGEPHVTLLPLRRLSRGDSAAIIGGVAGGKALPDALLDHLLAHADGVPLFIEELTSALLDSGLLRETTESYLIDGPLPALAVPTTLQASLVSRLDRLGPVRDLALIGAAIGREFSHELVAAVASLPAEELDAALERLTASGLVSRTGAPPAATYAFRHVLVQDAAYATLLKSRRRQLHSDIAKVLVERFPAMAERLPQVAAHHFTEASLAGEAIGYWRRAGQLASTRSAGREAVTCFEQALRLLETQPETRSTLELGCDLRLELRPALLEAGSSSQRMLECLDQAEALAERLDDDYRRAQTYASMTATHTLRGDLEAAYATGSRALDFAGRLGDLRTRIVATSLLVQVHHARGEYARVVELAPGNLAALPAAWVQETLGLGRPPSVLDRGWLVMSLAQLGRFAEAAEPAAEAIRLAAATKHPLTIGWAHFAAGSVPLRKGDWAQALEQYERVIAVCRAAKSFFLLPLALAPIPWVLAQVGETSKALERLEECEQLVARQAASGGSLGVFGPLFAWMGRAALVLGRLEEAQRLGAQAVEACQHHPGYAADALQLKGEIATHHDCFKAESAELDYHKALALAAPSGMRPLIAQCRLGLGKVYRRAGRQTEARNELIAATTMYREMDMSFWLKQAETEMVQLQAPS
jgi:tetratricopeptide (TPR) repeat protein